MLKKFNNNGTFIIGGNNNNGGGSWNEGRRASSPGFMGMSHRRVSNDGSNTYGLDGLVLSMSGRKDAFGLKSTAEGVEGEEGEEGELEESESEEEMEEESVHERIERELNELEEEERLGVRFYRVEQGSRIGSFKFFSFFLFFAFKYLPPSILFYSILVSLLLIRQVLFIKKISCIRFKSFLLFFLLLFRYNLLRAFLFRISYSFYFWCIVSCFLLF